MTGRTPQRRFCGLCAGRPIDLRLGLARWVYVALVFDAHIPPDSWLAVGNKHAVRGQLPIDGALHSPREGAGDSPLTHHTDPNRIHLDRVHQRVRRGRHRSLGWALGDAHDNALAESQLGRARDHRLVQWFDISAPGARYTTSHPPIELEHLDSPSDRTFRTNELTPAICSPNPPG